MPNTTYTVEIFWEGGDILDDKDPGLSGAGEIYFETLVTVLGRSAQETKARFPTHQTHKLNKGPFSIGQTVFKGPIQEGEELLFEVFPHEQDVLFDDHFVPYRRRFLRSPEQWNGSYHPSQDPLGDRETLKDWKIKYRISVT